MRKTFIVILLAILPYQYSYAQDNVVPAQPHDKIFDHYIGVQINQLIKQVFNFSSSTTTNNNPYLLTYSITQRKTGWGLRFGMGFNSSTNSTDDGITKTDNNINDMQFRLGIEKSFRLNDKWSTGAGLDGLFNLNDDKTTTRTNTSLDTSNAVTHSTTTSYGGGGMAWLRYNITDKILLGTEVSFYYTVGKVKQSNNISSFNNGSVNTSVSNTNSNISSGVINLPVALFLIINF